MKTRFYISVRHSQIEPPYNLYVTTSCRNSQAAIRKALKHWIKYGYLKRQPKTTNTGGWEHITYEVHSPIGT